MVGFSVGLQTLLQSSATDAYRGRVFGAYGTTVALMTLIGQAMASVLGNRFGVVPIFTLAGCFEFLGGLVAFILLRRASHLAAEAQSTGDIAAMALED